MHNEVPYNPCNKFENNIFWYNTGKTVSISSKLACLNNHWLLNQHGITLLSQIRQIGLKGLKINRQLYYSLMNGSRMGVNQMFLGYLLQYWIEEHNYRITFNEFQSDNFRDIFLTRIKPEADAKANL